MRMGGIHCGGESRVEYLNERKKEQTKSLQQEIGIFVILMMMTMTLSLGPLDRIQCPHRADAGQPTLVCLCLGGHHL